MVQASQVAQSLYYNDISANAQPKGFKIYNIRGRTFFPASGLYHQGMSQPLITACSPPRCGSEIEGISETTA